MLILTTTAAVAAMAWASLATAQTSAPKESDLPVVVTSGEATVKRAPDRAFVAISAESRAKTSREAQKARTPTR